jgi:hypothetical protein
MVLCQNITLWKLISLKIIQSISVLAQRNSHLRCVFFLGILETSVLLHVQEDRILVQNVTQGQSTMTDICIIFPSPTGDSSLK